jgi:ABC-2 type transport system permease protein
MLRYFFNQPFWALVRKEVRQILRNKQLIFLLIIPPIVQLMLYGSALNPDVRHLKLGVIDYANIYESRELVSAITENQIFDAQPPPLSETELSRQVETGQLTVGVIIPPEFARRLATQNAEVQIFIDAVNANTAGIARSYLSQIILQYNRQLQTQQNTLPVQTQVLFLYNPGLTSSWFFVPGVMGLVLTLIGTITAAITVVKEKDVGTLEQLLMTPAGAWDILLAKIIPLFFLLMGDVVLALTLGRVVFGVPFRGSFLLFIVLSAGYLFVSISIGTLLGTVYRQQQQVLLTAFFINMPLVQTSGAISPIESMPPFFRTLSLLNPMRHYIAIVRGILLKGSGFDVLWMHALALALFAIVLMAISIRQFRSQLN